MSRSELHAPLVSQSPWYRIATSGQKVEGHWTACGGFMCMSVRDVLPKDGPSKLDASMQDQGNIRQVGGDENVLSSA